MTQPRSPTTTGKIERFHRSMRAEFLSNKPAFANLKVAQQALDEWVDYYNTSRPHQSLDMATPAQRFTPAAPTSLAALSEPPGGDERTGDGWVSRPVCANGIVCVSWQQVSIGRHYAGARCDVHVDGDLLRFWIGEDLVKTAARTSRGEVRNKGPYAPARRPNHKMSVKDLPTQKCQESTDSEQAHHLTSEYVLLCEIRAISYSPWVDRLTVSSIRATAPTCGALNCALVCDVRGKSARRST